MPNHHPAETNPGQAAASSPQVSWVHPAGMGRLSFANYVLRILTLGIYHFWGKTEVRKRIWSGLRFDGEPLVYTGTGRELFLGFLIVFFLFLLPISLGAFAVMLIFGEVGLVIFQWTLIIAVLYLSGVAIYRALRYRLSRTLWRGIRGSLEGGSWSFGWTYFWTLVLPAVLAILLLIVLGLLLGANANDPERLQTLAPIFGIVGIVALLAVTWIVPWRATKLQSRLVGDMRFGDRPFSFTAPVGPLYKRFAGFWFGCVVLVFALLAIGGSLIDFPNLPAEGEARDPQMSTETLKTLGIIYLLMGVGFLIYYLLSAFYRAFQFNHFAAHTHYEGATFHGTATGRGLVWVAIGNFFIWLGGLVVGVAFFGFVGSIGHYGMGLPLEDPMARIFLIVGIVLLAASASLFQPIIQARTNGYFARNLAINGRIDVAAIQQGAEQNIRRGEGLAEAFDIDAI